MVMSLMKATLLPIRQLLSVLSAVARLYMGEGRAALVAQIKTHSLEAA